MEKEDLKTFRRIIAKKNFNRPIYFHDVLEFALVIGKYKIKGVDYQPSGLCKAIEFALEYIKCPPTLFGMPIKRRISSILKTFYELQTGHNPGIWFWWKPNNWYVRTRFIKSVIKGTENVMIYDGKCYRLFQQCIKSKSNN